VLGGPGWSAIAVGGAQSIALRIVLGVAGAIAGAFAGYENSHTLVRALKVSGLRHRFLEDQSRLVEVS